jgi:hypothetical protein
LSENPSHLAGEKPQADEKPQAGEEPPATPARGGDGEERRIAPPIPNEEPVMSVEDTTTDIPVPAQEPYVSSADDTWAQEPLEELPPRPRRRLLGTGGNPIFLALLGVLLIASGFIGGVLVEKGETSSSSGSGAAGLASRFAALRGGAGAGSTTTGSGASSASGAAGGGGAEPGGFAGRFGGPGGAGGATIGEVSYISGSTLYVTNFEGATVKIATSPASRITKTVKADVHAIHPGEMVVIRGSKGTNGAIRAESVSVSAAGAAGGLGSLFGGGGAGRGGGAAAGGGSGGGGLFGG